MIQKFKGTKDLIGAEASVWIEAEGCMQAVFEHYGSLPVRTPVIESAELFCRSVGEVTDIVQKEMYRFKDRSDTEIALRPEGTAGVVRALIEGRLQEERPLNKLYYMGPMFRAERPQAGRLRQFHQVGAEIFGTDSPYADVEAIELIGRLLESCGIRDARIYVNSLGSREDRQRYSEVLRGRLAERIADLCVDCRGRLDRNVFRVLDCKKDGCRAVAESMPRIADHLSATSRQRFEWVCATLAQLGIEHEVNPRVIRGLDYYTDTVFEVTHDALGAQDALAAGGRYDGLVESLGGAHVPAVGFAIGMERLMIVRQKIEVRQTAESTPSVFVIGMDGESKRVLYSTASALRKEGVLTLFDFEDRSLKASLRAAAKTCARYVIIMGDSERQSGTVLLKDMAQSGVENQKTIPISYIVAILKEKQIERLSHAS